jgi:hypothetical protein
MAGTGEERQYLLARESDMWLDEAERIQNRLDDLDPGDDEDSDVLKDKVWLEYVLDKREELTEELLTMQGVLTDDDAVDIPMAVGD